MSITRLEWGLILPIRAPEDLTPALMIAVHRYLARSPAMVLTFQLEDVLGQAEQVNLPGTTDEHPNWRRRLTADLTALARDPRLVELGAALRRERGGGRAPAADRQSAVTAPSRAARVPCATYRLQMHRGFSFARATEIVPYLARLGVSHVYASPILQARAGSLHGYDIIDHGRVNEELGGEEGLERFVDALHRHDMGLVLDIVPNHMGVGSDNAWWMSVLEHGPASPYATFFDIDWRPDRPALRGRVLLPLLEDHYGRVLERGLLRLLFHGERGAFEIAYHEHRFPVDPRTYPVLLAHDLDRLRARIGADAATMLELQSLLDALGNLPEREVGGERAVARLRDADVLRRQLARLVGASGDLKSFIEANVERFDGRPGDPGELRPAGRPARRPGLPPGLLAHRRGRDQLPPVLRHQRPGRVASGGPAHLRGYAPAGAGVRAPWAGGRPSHRPFRRTPRSGGLLREAVRGDCRRRRKRRAAGLDRRREDPRVPRATAGGLGGARHHRLRLLLPDSNGA
ncbi:MAG: 4-alpha-glucanotransferase [Acidobacteriota bacterium]